MTGSIVSGDLTDVFAAVGLVTCVVALPIGSGIAVVTLATKFIHKISGGDAHSRMNDHVGTNRNPKEALRL
jgi:hypothetical protein